MTFKPSSSQLYFNLDNRFLMFIDFCLVAPDFNNYKRQSQNRRA
jgi:hypothetical protein